MVDAGSRFFSAFSACPLIAILRGLVPDDAAWVGETLFESGIQIIEVPLNSPLPYESIEILRNTLPQSAIIGAGTVTRIEQVSGVSNAGGEIIVSPNTDPSIIKASIEEGMISAPGCLTPSEAFSAIYAGAHALKLFPANIIGAAGVKAIGAVLPRDIPLLAVGGVGPGNMNEFTEVGIAGFGLGSSLFHPGIERAELAKRSIQSVQAVNDAIGA